VAASEQERKGASAYDAARGRASAVEPSLAAERAGFEVVGGPDSVRLDGWLFQRPVRVDADDLSCWYTDDETEVPRHMAAFLLYHLGTSDGSEPTGEWISFADLPDGRFYVDAWRGYTGSALVRRFGDDVAAVRHAAEAVGATPLELTSDAAYVFELVPKVPVALLYWSGDDEFPARADFLFDRTAGRHLPTDALAVACAFLTSMLVRAA
jgi:hypothetical protein